jgi:hypothetical protein
MMTWPGATPAAAATALMYAWRRASKSLMVIGRVTSACTTLVTSHLNPALHEQLPWSDDPGGDIVFDGHAAIDVVFGQKKPAGHGMQSTNLAIDVASEKLPSGHSWFAVPPVQ